MTRRILKKIFSIKNEGEFKVFRIAGIKMKFRNKKHLTTSTPNWRVGAPGTILNGFIDFMSKASIREAYVNLVAGLDKDSILVVASLINRIKKIANNDYNFYVSPAEKAYVEDFNNFSTNIVELEKNVFAFGKYLLPVNHFDSGVLYKDYGLNSFKTLDKDKSIIDVGASVGDSALLFSDYTTEKVYSFEPTATMYNFLKKALELNNIKNVVPIQQGLSNCEGEMEIYSAGARSSITDFNYSDSELEKIQLTTLDKFVEENNLNVGLIKVDIEGAEQLFLEGAKNTIQNQKPALIISIYHTPEDFFMIKPIIESWNLGYKFKIMNLSQDILCGICLFAEVEN